MNSTPWINLALALIPEVKAVVSAIAALRKKYPALTADQITAIIADVTAQADTAFDDVLARIAQMLHDPKTVNKLLETETNEELGQMLLALEENIKE